jgi:hypothetical protein
MTIRKFFLWQSFNSHRDNGGHGERVTYKCGDYIDSGNVGSEVLEFLKLLFCPADAEDRNRSNEQRRRRRRKNAVNE